MKVLTTALSWIMSLALLAGCAMTVDPSFQLQQPSNQIEPEAGQWQTWVLASSDELRPLAPPDAAATDAELQELEALAAQRDGASLDAVAYWDAGSPSYRWLQIAMSQVNAKPISPVRWVRMLALMNVAVYDATVAAWDAKYAYNRPHPSQADPTLSTVLPNPASPSYPSEHAAAAGAASAILAYIYPDDAQVFTDLAEAAAQSRVLAGVHYPSDVEAGLELGRAVAARVIERAQADGSDVKWTGTVPTGPGMWVGDQPAEPLMGTWKTWVLSSGSQLRPDPPPAYDSPQMLAELEELKTLTRTVQTNTAAFFWQANIGQFSPYDWAMRHVFEEKLDSNPPRAARVYALMSVAGYDAAVACWDGKYTYWAIRPAQLDPALTTLFPTPPHPSYPAGHACHSGAVSGVLAYLFPSDSKDIEAKARQAADSRMWAGIHYRSDIEVGLALGQSVAQLVIERAEAMVQP
jgi:membrane-associated phospholipid phosphatase